MTDQKQGGRAISLLSVILVVLLTLVSVLSAVAIVERCHAQGPPSDTPHADKDSKTEHLSMEAQYDVAIHEAGHAVLGHLLIPDRAFDRVWLYTERPSESGYLGMTETGDAVTSYPAEVRNRSTAIFFLGGLAAEEIFFSTQPPDEYEDKDVAGEEMLDYCEKVGCACPPASKVGDQCLLKDMMRAERERLYAVAVACLGANKEAVVTLANQLYRKTAEPIPPEAAPAGYAGGRWRKLDAEELRAFFAAHPLTACPEK